MTTHFDDSRAFQTLALMSALFNAFFFFLMMWVKELQAHPMKLFMYLIASESILLFIYVFSLNTCSFDLYKLFAWTVLYGNDCATYLRSLEILVQSSIFVSIFAASLSGCLQVSICIDLILTIKSPFTSKEARMPYYYFFSAIPPTF